jgi:hypothetical protein
MKLTEKEKSDILKSRTEAEDKLPKMVGYAKEDLYQVNDYIKDSWFASASERKEIINDFSNNFIELSVPAGAEFECYITENGEECWYDTTDSGLFAAMDAEWARKYLKDIKPIKKKKKKKKK